jgi:hypothetical protein
MSVKVTNNSQDSGKSEKMILATSNHMQELKNFINISRTEQGIASLEMQKFETKTEHPWRQKE